MRRRAKIIATLGPATDDPAIIEGMIRAGMDVARINMSHGDHSQHARSIATVREVAARLHKPVGVLVDLQGPKIRVATFVDGPQQLVTGAEFTITTRDVPGDATCVGTTFDGLPRNVSAGDRLLVDDGNIVLRALAVDDTDVRCEVVVGGRISDHKGINLPGVAVDVPALSQADEENLHWAIEQGADLIALSFVRSPDDVTRVREIMAGHGVRLPVIAKIEKPQAVEVLDAIIKAFDMIMVARGDLGVEMPLEQVPVVQKSAIERCRRSARPVIVATQMLESMITASRPTRAEASDCANAVLDGGDALMLSGETSVGAHPVAAVQVMSDIITSTEDHGLDRIPPLGTQPHTMAGAITRAAVEVAHHVGARYLCMFTASGNTARRMSRLRDGLPMLAFTYDDSTRRAMTPIWGIESVRVPFLQTTDEIVLSVDTYLIDSGRAQPGDRVVVVAGSPPGIPGSTNDLRVLTVGEAVGQAAPGYRRTTAQLMRGAVDESRATIIR
ncbi:MAG: pyruvate kinase [Pseudoclavibacter caeni]|jgi:pyruvate kinase